jgi:hypothetical protein
VDHPVSVKSCPAGRFPVWLRQPARLGVVAAKTHTVLRRLPAHKSRHRFRLAARQASSRFAVQQPLQPSASRCPAPLMRAGSSAGLSVTGRRAIVATAARGGETTVCWWAACRQSR